MAAPAPHQDRSRSVGRLIRTARLKRGLSSGACAAAANMYSRRDWLNYEAGRHLPNCVTLWRIAAALGVSADALCPTDMRLSPACPRSRHASADLTTNERAALHWIARRTPGVWQGVEFHLEELLSTAPRTATAGKQLRRAQLRDRAMRLEAAGHLIYAGQGRYRLHRRLWRNHDATSKGTQTGS